MTYSTFALSLLPLVLASAPNTIGGIQDLIESSKLAAPSGPQISARLITSSEVDLEANPSPVWIVELKNMGSEDATVDVMLGGSLAFEGGQSSASLPLALGQTTTMRVNATPEGLSHARSERRFESSIIVAGTAQPTVLTVTVVSDPCRGIAIPMGYEARVSKSGVCEVVKTTCPHTPLEAAAKPAPAGKHYELEDCQFVLHGNPTRSLPVGSAVVALSLREPAAGKDLWTVADLGRDLNGGKIPEHGIGRAGIRISADRRAVESYAQVVDADFTDAWHWYAGTSGWTARWKAPDGYTISGVRWAGSAETSGKETVAGKERLGTFVPGAPRKNSIILSTTCTQTQCLVTLGGLVLDLVETNDHYRARMTDLWGSIEANGFPVPKSAPRTK